MSRGWTKVQYTAIMPSIAAVMTGRIITSMADLPFVSFG
jgi:hypothetical protein